MHGIAKDAIDSYIYNFINSIINQKTKNMRTLNTNQVSETLSGTKTNTWNSKRRYR
ncbi:hypothetical protein [Hyunsoonleella flava]|uniref:hypothetical protein n=1 Tax=Hyunsoonleella flava TaxID=2527939 RepID=UPI0013EEF52C|nr:hypothetical protein [Hyunsoonleella flava]